MELNMLHVEYRPLFDNFKQPSTEKYATIDN